MATGAVPEQRSGNGESACAFQELAHQWRADAVHEVLIVRSEHRSTCEVHRDVSGDLADLDRGLAVVRVEPWPGCPEEVPWDDLARLDAAGGQVRISAPAPYSLLIVDRRVAVIGRHPDVPGSAEVVTDPLLVRGLVSLGLEHIRRAWPWTAVLAEGMLPELSPVEMRVLALLAECTTDRQAARRLGVTDRQLRRYVHTLHRRMGVGNRYQLGLRSAELGCSPPEPTRASASGHDTRPAVESPVAGC